MNRTLWISYMDNNVASHAFASLFDSIVPWSEGAQIKKEDVVIFSGGADVNPEMYGELRGEFTYQPDKFKDERERAVFRHAQSVGASCLGICRGAQLLCVLSGGKLIQHVTGHNKGSHNVMTYEGGFFEVSSVHHQMMWPYNVKNHFLIANAVSVGKSFCEYGKDFEYGHGYKGQGCWSKEPEIVYFPDTRSLCIQGHPEEPYCPHDSTFTRACHNYVEKFLFKGRK
jgi:hypothetical protein